MEFLNVQNKRSRLCVEVEELVPSYYKEEKIFDKQIVKKEQLILRRSKFSLKSTFAERYFLKQEFKKSN